MAEREARARRFLPKGTSPLSAIAGRPPPAAGHRGAAAQLAALHDVLRHGPAVPLVRREPATGATGPPVVQRKVGMEFELITRIPTQAVNAQAPAPQALAQAEPVNNGSQLEFVTGPLPSIEQVVEASQAEVKPSGNPVPKGKPDGKS